MHSRILHLIPILPFLTLILSPGRLCATNGQGTDCGDHPSIDVGTRPESVTRAFGNDLFVTVMNGTNPGDGVIKRIRGRDVSVFAKGLDEPKGLAFVANSLVASDLTRLVRIDETGKVSILASSIDFPHEVLYLNDVAAAPDGNGVYVTDMGDRSNLWESPGVFYSLESDEARAIQAVGRVYHVTLDGKVTEVIRPSKLMLCPNGVAVGKDGQLLVTGFFNGNLLEYRNGDLQIVQGGLRGADGVEQDTGGNYYVSSWNQGKVWLIGESGGISVIVDGLQTAADFYLDEEKGVLYVPDMKAGKVYAINL